MMDLFEKKDIKPMLIGVEGEPFDSPDYIYELKLDGERCIAYLSEAGTELRNKRNVRMLPKVPELSDIHRQAKKTCILDGELIVIKKGVPDFFEIQRRSLMSDKFKIELAAKKYPASFTAFDILYYDGEPVVDKPLMERKKLLAKAFRENEKLALSRYIETAGTALFDLAKQQNLEGVVAKKKNSSYKFDTRTKEWIKIKFLKDDDFVICGYVVKETPERSTASIILGSYEQGKLKNRGHVVIGVASKDFEMILNQKRASECPFERCEKDAVYIEPELVCTVTYMERLKHGGLRRAVFKGIRSDKSVTRKSTP